MRFLRALGEWFVALAAQSGPYVAAGALGAQGHVALAAVVYVAQVAFCTRMALLVDEEAER